MGIDPSRLRFLPQDKDEETHRANLQIADVVLDTYPYNGATTTLEVLWMGLALVTRVGGTDEKLRQKIIDLASSQPSTLKPANNKVVKKNSKF